MKTFISSIFFLLFLSSASLFSQKVQLYETLNYREAVENGTRSRDGNPGPKYWQNHSDYDIEVRLDTAEKKIFGKETVTYYNESPNEIRNLVLRLYQDVYKKGAIRNGNVNPENVHNGLSIDTLIINGHGFFLNPITSLVLGTNLFIRNIAPVAPGGQLEFTCKWSYNIPVFDEEMKRTGYFKDNAWFIGYFYPQVAVYDDMESLFGLDGWDLERFHQGLQEFYNDFNNYKVKIEVPEGFYVWATGDLVNEEEVFSPEFLKILHRARKSDENVKILSKEDSDTNNLLNNIWKFEAKHVPDFAFGTAPDYIWDASSVKVGKRRISVDVAYPADAKTFPRVMDIAKATVKYASEEYPAVEFPYDHVTVFNGNKGGGMEFPMIANDEDADPALVNGITFHEIFHNYTPFMLGLNEKRYPFMDEGLTEYFTEHYLLHEHNSDMFFGYANIMELYSQTAKSGDSPLFSSAYQLSPINTVYYYYVKPNVAYKFFAEMVGEEEFNKAFREFADRWEGKHPTPYDFFYTMNDVLKKNYNWFWKSWFFDFGYPDLALERKGNKIVVKRPGAGALPVPVKLIVENKDGTTSSLYKPMNVWKKGALEIIIEPENMDQIKSVRVNTEKIPDVNAKNNVLDLSDSGE